MFGVTGEDLHERLHLMVGDAGGESCAAVFDQMVRGVMGALDGLERLGFTL